jgi:hypothetical protein
MPNLSRRQPNATGPGARGHHFSPPGAKSRKELPAAADMDLVFKFTPKSRGYGEVFMNKNSAFHPVALHPFSAESMVVADLNIQDPDDIVVDFGPGLGALGPHEQ